MELAIEVWVGEIKLVQTNCSQIFTLVYEIFIYLA